MSPLLKMSLEMFAQLLAYATVILLMFVSIRGIRRGALMFGLLLLCFATDAQACNRCGIFGRGCRFAVQSYYQPTYYAPAVTYVPPTTQNFVFNNSYPTPLLAQGNSVYGYSLAAQAYSVDPAQVLDRSGRLAELAFTSGQKAINDFNDTAGNALALSADASRRSQNTLLALSAIQANEQPAQTLSFRATVTNGKLNLERIEGTPAESATAPPCTDCQQPPPPDQQGRLQLRTDSNPQREMAFSAGMVCGKCHDGTGKKDTPKGLVIDGRTPLSVDQYRSAAKAVISGRMPPKATLSDEQKAEAVAELASLSPKQVSAVERQRRKVDAYRYAWGLDLKDVPPYSTQPQRMADLAKLENELAVLERQ